MNLADIFSGGKNSDAEDILKDQLAKLNAVQTPTAAQLTLPQLQEYVSAGILTPDEAKAYLAEGNAFDKTTASNAGLDTELGTIGELQNIVNSGGKDAQEQSDVQGILNTLGTTERGNNEAILRDAASRGVSNSGTTLAARLEANQGDAMSANKNALDAEANAQGRNLAAINAKGTLGGNVQQQQYLQEQNKANAANAIAEFNAKQKQDVGNLNTTTANSAKAANLANAQDVSNKNTVSAQTQEESIPAAQQKAYEDALSKATAGTTAASNVANAETKAGEQNAGILGGLIGTAGTVGASYLSGNPYTALASALKSGTSAPNTDVATNSATPMVASGGRIVPGGVQPPMNMKSGGSVPGEPMVPGDSAKNDTVRANLSPDEIVLPRTVAIPAMQGDTSKVMDFLKSLPKPQAPSVHPKAILDTLRALNMHHSGAM